MTVWYNPELDEIGVLTTFDYTFEAGEVIYESVVPLTLFCNGWEYIGEL